MVNSQPTKSQFGDLTGFTKKLLKDVFHERGKVGVEQQVRDGINRLSGGNSLETAFSQSHNLDRS